MFGERFELNEQTIPIVEEIGRHMPGGFFIYKASEPEELLYANRAVIDIFGCDDLEDFKKLTGFTFKGMLHPDDYDRIEESIVEQIDVSSDNLDYVEYRIICKDGSIRWVDDYGHYTETQAYGGIYYVFISDITEKKEESLRHIEEDEKQKEEQNKLITALASDYWSVYYIELDTDSGVCYQSHPEIYRALETGENFKYLETFTDYAMKNITDEYREEFLRFIQPDAIREGLKENRVISYRYMTSRNGEEKYEMIRFAGVRHPEDRDDHMVHAVGACFSDIDAETRKTMVHNKALSDALIAAEQANRAKTAFLSNMSHEIRTPMNAIISLDNLALSDIDISNRTKDYLEKIGTSANHLLNIINDILDMTRIESGRMALNSEEFSFAKVMEQVSTMIGGQCRNKGLKFTLVIDENVHDYYVGDSMKLKQILINILGNSVKFTPRGGEVSVKVNEIARYDGNSTLRFCISDTGIGMSEEYLPRLFDAFTQEDSSTTNQYGSTGLGMPITKSLVELMNGSIDVKSKKGVGTEFTVTLSLKISDKVDNEKNVSKNSSAEILSGRRVMLAEDVVINAEIMMMVLAARDIEVDHVENGQLAVEHFREHEMGYYDAILMDIRMPVMDGIEATKCIRAMDRKDAKEIPIIALTANAFDEDVHRSLQAGLNAHLSKPTEPDVLYETLVSFLAD